MGRFATVWKALLVLVLMAGLAQAQEPAAEQPWQSVVTAQIEAFRAHDAAGAFQYAAAPFQTAFPTAEAFFVSIMGAGYAPIMDSSSHSFGSFQQLDAHSVVQEVMLTGKDLSRYEAIYMLTEEAKGWRVSGVQLAKTPGIGV